jgi:hypothetical protein
MRFSKREARWFGRKSHRPENTPDPNSPGSYKYAERHAVRVCEVQEGMTREDIGYPIP